MQRATRYFAIHPDNIQDYRALFVPDNDFLPLDENPNCKVLADYDGKKVVHVLLGSIQLENMREIAGVNNPLSMEAVGILGLSGSYLGATPDEVRENTGQDFTKAVTYTDPETGETVEKTVDLLNHVWR